MSATTTGDVFPQLFVYDGAVNATFTNDLFNVGAGRSRTRPRPSSRMAT